jgi:hypothetical protein
MVKVLTTINPNEEDSHLEEIIYCMDNNATHPLIAEIIVFIDVRTEGANYTNERFTTSISIPADFVEKLNPLLLKFLDNNDNISFIIIKNRPTYSDFFHYTNDYPNETWILCNSDIYYPISNSKIMRKVLSNNFDKFVICLTRYDILQANNTTPGYRIKYDGLDLMTTYDNGCSIDTWIFKSPIKQNKTNYNIEIGRMGCDGMMNYQLSLNYAVKNPCMDLISIHKHKGHPVIYETDSMTYKGTAMTIIEYINSMKKNGFNIKNIPFSYENGKVLGSAYRMQFL